MQAAIYATVSTDKQECDNQIAQLLEFAGRLTIRSPRFARMSKPALRLTPSSSRP